MTNDCTHPTQIDVHTITFTHEMTQKGMKTNGREHNIDYLYLVLNLYSVAQRFLVRTQLEAGVFSYGSRFRLKCRFILTKNGQLISLSLCWTA